MGGHDEHRDRAQDQQIDIPARPLLQLLVRHRVVAHAERFPEMTRCERAESEPERRRLRELAAQFVAEQKIMEGNQHDPVRQTDNADEQEPHKHATYNVADQCRVVLLGLRLAQRARNQRGDDRGQRG